MSQVGLPVHVPGASTVAVPAALHVYPVGNLQVLPLDAADRATRRDKTAKKQHCILSGTCMHHTCRMYACM